MPAGRGMRNPSYDILFEPVPIGPLVAKNRFYQVPHCNGGGYRDPSALAAMRGVKAEGGWGVIFTEQTEMHHSSEITPVHRAPALGGPGHPGARAHVRRDEDARGAGRDPARHYGMNGPNFYSKEVPLAPSALPVRTFTNDPVQARAMDKGDIAQPAALASSTRRGGREVGRLRPRSASTERTGSAIFQHFLSRATNQRTDEYGGSLENRSRFVSEVIGDIREAVGDTMAIASGSVSTRRSASSASPTPRCATSSR